MRKHIGYGLAILTWWTLWSPGVNPAAGQTVEAKEGSLGSFAGDTWRDFKSLPSTGNAWWLLGGTALAVSVYQFEDPDGAASALDRGVLDPVSDFGNIWGDMRVQVPLAVGAWGLGSAAGNPAMAALGYDLSRGLLLSYGIVSTVKLGVNRTRPNGADYSFPSGHTAAAFTTAGVVSRRYGGWAGGAAIGLGVLTGMGRMEDMKHFASDVAAGATIGWIVGRTAGERAGRSAMGGKVTWQLQPVGRGLAVLGTF